MDLALRHLEVDPFEDLLALDCRVEAGDREDRFAHRAGSGAGAIESISD